MAKYLDMNGLAYLWQQIKLKLNGKVDVVEGKGLSTNDFTTEEKDKLSNIEIGANKYVHPTSGVTASSYMKVTVDNQGHVTSGSNPTTLAEFGITDAANKIHTHISDDITSLDASKLTGTISIDRLPVGALERLVIVANDAERFALTQENIQKGDTVKVTETEKLYFVIDDTQLASENGYEIYTAGGATSVPWSGIIDKPTVFTPDEHIHTIEQITDFPTIPTELKNPNALTITVNGIATIYDGSEAQAITITEYTLGITAITNSEIDAIIANN